MNQIILTIIEGPYKGKQFFFEDRNTCIIGRADDCNPQLPDDENHNQISRYHCLLDINPPLIRIRDFGSLNGTYINNIKIGQRKEGETPSQGAKREYPIHDLTTGDVICLGTTETVFQVEIKEEKEIPLTIKLSENNPQKPHLWELIQNLFKKLKQGNLPELKNIKFLAEYELIKELGEGGCGKVYLARHSHTKKDVALKVMLPEVAQNQNMIERFLREVESNKSLKHPHIVELLDHGYAEGVFFFTLEFCEGGSLQDLINKSGENLPLKPAIEITLQILKGLEYAHNVPVNVKLPNGKLEQSKGLVHRDLKPDNILLTNRSKLTPVKIADFGLAKAFDLAGLSGLSVTDSAMGTPVFMCRQQFLSYKYVKPEVDVWATAAILYYLLTGYFPRNFDDSKDPFRCLLTNDPVPILQRNSQIPSPIAEVIDLALKEKPELYFKTARDFRKALELAIK